MVCVNQTRPHCVNQMGKTQSKPLAERHGRGTAWERHGMCEPALTRQGNGSGTAWERHGMCELAVSVLCERDLSAVPPQCCSLYYSAAGGFILVFMYLVTNLNMRSIL
jgi:hypothetical protein